MRPVIRPPEMFHLLISLLFFFGAFSLSSIFHDENKPLIRAAIQIVIFSISILLIISAGYRPLKYALWGVPIAISLAIITNSQYPIHLLLLSLVCLILIRRSEVRDSDSWAYASWAGCFCGLILNILLGKYGIAESKIYYVVTSGTLKNSMGFFNPNIAALLAVSAVIFSSLAKKRMIWVISLTVYAYVLSETYARTSAAILAIYYINILIIHKAPNFIKLASSIVIHTLSILIIVFVVFMESFPGITGTDLFETLDKLFSYRLSLALPSLSEANLLVPGEAPRNMDLALANIIIIFGSALLIVFLTASMFVSTRLKDDRIDFYLMCLMICFASLFSENIAYIYMPIGLIFAVPFAYVIHYFFGEPSRYIKKSP